MLINLSNHPSSNWEDKQIKEAEGAFGSVVDLAFPTVPPNANILFIIKLADEYFIKCVDLLNKSTDSNNAVHIMGEMTFSFALVNRLIKTNIVCVASTSERNVSESNNTKISKFGFVRFREYNL
jgi:hypothetical protein